MYNSILYKYIFLIIRYVTLLTTVMATFTMSHLVSNILETGQTRVNITMPNDNH